MYEVIEKVQEVTGMWRLRIVISPDETTFLCFESDPDEETIKTTVDNYLVNISAQNQP